MRGFTLALFLTLGPVVGARAETARCDECDAADVTVSSFRWHVDANRRAIIWLQFKNMSGVTWLIESVYCDFYDGDGRRLYGRTFELEGFPIYGSAPLRESGGFDIRYLPRLVKAGLLDRKSQAGASSPITKQRSVVVASARNQRRKKVAPVG